MIHLYLMLFLATFAIGVCAYAIITECQRTDWLLKRAA